MLFQFMNLWTEYTELKRANAQDDVLATVQKLHEENQRGQFLMKL